jgi:hypothetical protein
VTSWGGRSKAGKWCPPAGEPTDAPPGSAAKLAVFQERASRREALFHPLDICLDFEKPSLLARILPRDVMGLPGGSRAYLDGDEA